MPSSRKGSANWRQNTETASPHSSRVLGIFLLVVFLGGLAWFLYQMRPTDPERLFLSSVTLQGYSESDAHLPPIRDAYEGSSGLLETLEERLEAEIAKEETPEISKQLETAFDAGIGAQEKDLEVLFFTGHAVAFPQDDGKDHEIRLVTSEYDPTGEKNAESASVSLRAALEQFAASGPHHKVVVLDVFRLPLDPWLGVSDHALPQKVSQLVSSLELNNLWVVLPCSEGQRSYTTNRLAAVLERDVDNESVLEAALRTALGDGARAGDGPLTLSKAFEAIEEAVDLRTAGLQTPQLLHAGATDPLQADELLLTRAASEAPADSDEDSPTPDDETGNAPEAAKPDEPKWWEEPATPLADDPRRLPASYAPVDFRRSLAFGEMYSDPTEWPQPSWERWSRPAQERRQALESVMLGTVLADRYVRLAAEVQPYSGRLAGIAEEVQGLISLLREATSGEQTVSTLNKLSVRLDEQHRRLNARLLTALHEAYSDLAAATQRRKKQTWDFEAELIAAAILESRCLSAEASALAQREARELLGTATQGKMRASLENKRVPRGVSVMSIEDVASLHRGLASLSGWSETSSATLADWLRDFTPNRPESSNSAWQDRLRLLTADPRSFGKADSDGPIPLPDAALKNTPVPNFALAAIGGGRTNDIDCDSDGEGQTTLRIKLGGDRLQVNDSVQVIATYDDSFLSLRCDGSRVRNNAALEVPINERYLVQMPLDVRLTPRGNTRNEPATVELQVASSEGAVLQALRFNVFPKSAKRSSLAIERKWIRDGKETWVTDDDEAFGVYSDWPNTIRVVLKNRRAVAASYGVAVYPIGPGEALSVDALRNGEAGLPLMAVGYAAAVPPEETATVSFNPLPAVPDAESDPSASEPADGLLLEKLRRLAQSQSTDPAEVERLAIVIYDQSGKPEWPVFYDAELRSPADYLSATPKPYGSDQLARFDLRPRQDAGKPDFVWPKKLKTARLTTNERPLSPRVRAQNTSVPLKPTAETPLSLTLRPNRLRPDQVPRLHVDIGNYPRAFSFRFDVSGEWFPSTDPFVEFLELVDNQGETIEPRGDVYVISQNQLPARAKFACETGENGSAKATAIGRGEGSRAVKERDLSAQIALSGDGKGFAISATGGQLSLPVEDLSGESFRQELLVTVNSPRRSLPITARSPLLIYDNERPELLVGNESPPRPTAQLGEKWLSLDVRFEEEHSGIETFRAFWDLNTDGLESKGEKPFTVNLVDPIKIGAVGATGTRVRVPLKEVMTLAEEPSGFSDESYQLMLKPVDHAGNEARQWVHAASVTVIKPRPKKPVAKKPKPKPKPKRPAKDHQLVVKVYYQNGSPIHSSDADNLTVEATGPSPVRFTYTGSSWKATGLRPGEYDVSVQGQLSGKSQVGAAEKVASSKSNRPHAKIKMQLVDRSKKPN